MSDTAILLVRISVYQVMSTLLAISCKITKSCLCKKTNKIFIEKQIIIKNRVRKTKFQFGIPDTQNYYDFWGPQKPGKRWLFNNFHS